MASLDKEAQQCLDVWLQARQEHLELIRKVFNIGSSLPLTNPEPFDWAIVDQAAAKEKSAEKDWHDAIGRGE